MNENIAVSIICNAYNHEKYIRDALESFIMQKTNFKFEVLVHDDASTDKTADIIREYEKKYPEIIKPIYQIENQCSKGKGLVGKIQYARVQGKYIAICEGDDYWTDPYKLQKQFDTMEKHPEVDVCAHSAVTIDAKNGKILKYMKPAPKDTIISVEDVINGGGGFVSTNSLFYRAAIDDNMPEFRKYFPLDYAMQIHSSLRGGMLYLGECMSAYRYMTQGSWTSCTYHNIEKMNSHYSKLIKMLEILDEETGYKFSKIIEKKISSNKLQQITLNYSYSEIRKNEEINKVFSKAPLSLKLRVMIKDYLPWLAYVKRKMFRPVKH